MAKSGKSPQPKRDKSPAPKKDAKPTTALTEALKGLTVQHVEGAKVGQMLQKLNNYFYDQNVAVEDIGVSDEGSDIYACVPKAVQEVFHSLYTKEANQEVIESEILRAMNSLATECASGKFTAQSASNRLIVLAIAANRPSAIVGKPLDHAVQHCEKFGKDSSVMWCLSQGSDPAVTSVVWLKYAVKAVIKAGPTDKSGAMALHVLERLANTKLVVTATTRPTDSVEINKAFVLCARALDEANGTKAKASDPKDPTSAAARYVKLSTYLPPLMLMWADALSLPEVRAQRFCQMVGSYPAKETSDDFKNLYRIVVELMLNKYPGDLSKRWAQWYGQMKLNKNGALSGPESEKAVRGATRVACMTKDNQLLVRCGNFRPALEDIRQTTDALLNKAKDKKSLELLEEASVELSSALASRGSASKSGSSSICSKWLVYLIAILGILGFALKSNDHCKQYPCAKDSEECYLPCKYIDDYKLEPYLTMTEESLEAARKQANEQLVLIQPYANEAYAWADKNVLKPVDDAVVKPLCPVVDEYYTHGTKLYNEHVHPTVEKAYAAAQPHVDSAVQWTRDTAYPEAEKLSGQAYLASLAALDSAQQYTAVAREQASIHGAKLYEEGSRYSQIAYKEGTRLSYDTYRYVDENVVKQAPVHAYNAKEWARVNVVKEAGPATRRHLRWLRRKITNVLDAVEMRMEHLFTPSIAKVWHKLHAKVAAPVEPYLKDAWKALYRHVIKPSYYISATATQKVRDLSERAGLNDAATFAPLRQLTGQAADSAKRAYDEYFVPLVYIEELQGMAKDAAQPIGDTVSSVMDTVVSIVEEAVEEIEPVAEKAERVNKAIEKEADAVPEVKEVEEVVEDAQEAIEVVKDVEQSMEDIQNTVEDMTAAVAEGEAVVDQAEAVIEEAGEVADRVEAVVADVEVIPEKLEKVMEDLDGVPEEIETVIEDGEKVVEQAEHVVSDGGAAVSETEKVAADSEVVLNKVEDVVQKAEDVVSEAQEVVEDLERVAKDVEPEQPVAPSESESMSDSSDSDKKREKDREVAKEIEMERETEINAVKQTEAQMRVEREAKERADRLKEAAREKTEALEKQELAKAEHERQAQQQADEEERALKKQKKAEEMAKVAKKQAEHAQREREEREALRQRVEAAKAAEAEKTQRMKEDLERAKVAAEIKPIKSTGKEKTPN